MLLIDNIKLAIELSLVLLDDKYDIEIPRDIPKEVEVLIIEIPGSNHFNFQTIVNGNADRTFEIVATGEIDARTKLRSALVVTYCVPENYKEEYLEAYDYYNSLMEYYKIDRKFTLRPLTKEELNNRL